MGPRVLINGIWYNKALLTLAAEAQAKSGHDILYMTSWLPHAYASSLEPVDDAMIQLIKQNGPVNDIVAYLGRAESRWLAVPATIGNQIQGPCSRIDLMKQYAGIDVQAMYPAGAPPNADNWTLDTFRPRRRATRPDSRLASGSERRRALEVPRVSNPRSGQQEVGGMVPSGRELTRSRMAILNPFNSLSRSSALIFDEAQTITANAALARSRGGNRSSAMAPTTLCIVAFTVEIIPDSLSVATGPHHRSTGSDRTKKRVSVAAVSRSASSFYHQPYQCRRSHGDCHVCITRHAIE